MSVKIENQQIVIRLPIEVLGTALAESEYVASIRDQGKDLVPVVVDATAFAHDIVHHLADEDHMGETPVTRMVDRTIEHMFMFGEPDGVEMRPQAEDDQ